MSSRVAAELQVPHLELTLEPVPPRPVFPATKYMGSKQSILPFIIESIRGLRVDRVLDAFSGTSCVGYALKQQGAEVHANDFLRSSFHIARATIENNEAVLSGSDLARLLRPNSEARTFIQDTFGSLYFNVRDNRFLDNLWANIRELRDPWKRSIALAAACRAAMKKRPRGIFTFTGKKGWDGRSDLRLSMRDQFLDAVAKLNASVFSNRKQNKAFCADVFDLDPRGYDAVYIDTPYISPYSDCDYTRRYHFVEGFCSYWKGSEIDWSTSTKKIRSYKTDFAHKSSAIESFSRLFDHFRNSSLIVSYSSNGIPSKSQMLGLLEGVGKSVRVCETRHKYSHGNQNHRVGRNKNSVIEYLFVAN